MPALGAPIVLDATHGEGGGALLRTAVAMSALTQQPLRVVGVRGGTKRAGLTAEDLILIRALAECVSAETVGMEIGSHEMSFLPTRRPRPINGKLELDSPPPEGETILPTVLLGSLAPILARSGAYSTLEASGETYGKGVLTYDYFAQTTLGAFRRMGLYADSDQHRAGYGRGSQGKVSLEVEPSVITGIEWPNRGRLLSATATIAISGLSESISERAEAHIASMARSAEIPVRIETYVPPGESTGIHLTINAEFERGMGGSTAMGHKGLRVEAVAQSAFEGFFDWIRSDATVDPFLADQIIFAAAIAEGDSFFSVSRLTSRLLTTVWVIKQFLPIRVTIKGREGEPGTVSIRR